MPSRAPAIAFAVALLLAGALQLISGLYYNVADLSRRADDLRRADVAARIAAALLPGSDRALAMSGRIAATRADGEFLLAAYRRVLAAAPVDGYRWSELARGLATAGLLGPEYDLAVERALRLAPRSPAVQAVLADIAWRERVRLSVAQQATLMPSLLATVHGARDPRDHLLKAVVRERRHPAFCSEFAGPPLYGARWCARVDADLARCAQFHKLPRREQRWCRDVGALP